MLFFKVDRYSGRRIDRLIRWFASHFIIRLLEVESIDLAMGVPGDACACPVARAAMRLFPNAERIEAWGREVHVLYRRKDGTRISESWFSDNRLVRYIKRIDATPISGGNVVNPAIPPAIFDLHLVDRRLLA